MPIQEISAGKPPTAVIVAAPYAPAGPITSCSSDAQIQIIGAGQYTFPVNETGLGFLPGMRVRAAAQDDPTQWVEGIVTAFDTVELVIAADLYNGAGVWTGWNINITGQPGLTGAKGDTGAVGPQGPPGGLTNPNVALTGTPTCPTAGPADASQQIANTTWVRNLLVPNYQPLDPDLTSLAAASAIGAIYYRSAADTWAAVTIGTNLTFVGGELSAVLSGTAPINSPAFTGDPTRTTAPAPGDSDASIPTTAWVQGELTAYAKLASPTFTGTVAVPTAGAADNSTAAANTQWVTTKVAGFQPLDSDLTSLAAFSASGVLVWRKADGDWQPVVMGANIAFDTTSGTLNASGGTGSGGIEEAPTDGKIYGRRSLGWTESVALSDLGAYAKIASPSFTGVPLAPTPSAGTNSQQLATTAYVKTNLASYLPTSGGNLTGSLAIVAASPGIGLYKTNGTSAQFGAYNQSNGQPRFFFVAADGTNETGGNSGSNFHIDRYADDGSFLGTPLQINRASGVVTISDPTLTGNVVAPTASPSSDSTTKVATTEFVQAAIAAALAAPGATGFTTGDVKLTLKTVAESGWILMNDGTIGSGTSGATYANANAQNLFALVWNNIPDAWAPVVGGRGASAAADWSAAKKLTLPKTLGRALAAAGSGSGLTARVLGSNLGEETHTQTVTELVSHGHNYTDPQHSHTHPGNGVNQQASYFAVDGGSQYNASQWGSYFAATNVAFTSITIQKGGSSQPANLMQPTTFLNVMIKL